jgi:hypothetical protein
MNGFDRHHVIRFCLLALIIALNPVVVSNGKIRGFYKCPGEILVSVFGIAFPFLLSITGARTADTTTIGRLIPRFGKTMNIARFQHDGQTQNHPYSQCRKQIFIFRRHFRFPGYGMLQNLDLFIQRVHYNQVALDRQGNILSREYRPGQSNPDIGQFQTRYLM